MMGGEMTGARSMCLGSRRGFTLMELMITMLISVIVVAGIYLFYEASITGYRIQSQTVDALGQLRLANHQVRKDLRSAAFNAPANSSQEPWVSVTGLSTVLNAITVEVDPAAPVANASSNTLTTPMRITLLGDFTAHRVFESVRIVGQDVVLQWNSVEDGDETEFNRIFNNRHFLRVETHGAARWEQFVPIVSANYNEGSNPTVNLADTVTTVGFGTGYEVTVCSYMRYRLSLDDRDTTENKFDLVRERIDPYGQVVGNAMVLAEYIVDMRVYDLCLNTATVDMSDMSQVPVQRECFPTLTDLQSTGGYTLGPGPANASHLLRSMSLKFSARTALEDETVAFVPRVSENSPMRSFELNSGIRGAARVFEVGATIFLTGLQTRRL
jgi:prepilin-type N-terminal cleavage/methylation domain-containing protein